MSNQLNQPQPTNSRPFHVYVRVRPIKQTEHLQCSKFQRPTNVIAVQENKVLVSDPDSLAASHFYSKQYEFFEVFDTHVTNSQIYERAIHSQLITLMKGNSTTLFAYGQTGAGKTHTIFGENQDGLIHLIINTLMENKESFSLSYLEIYNERVRDLLNNSLVSDGPQIIDSGKTDVVVQGLQWVEIDSPGDAHECLFKGMQRRATAETQHNVQSSRSHAVIQIMLKSNGAKLMVIDLAGSERSASSARKSSSLLHEGSNINRSLLALANCIKMLSENKQAKQHIPYRDSKLTRLLKASLMGQNQTLMIACVSPTWLTYDETINTLGYAQRAGMIKAQQQQRVPRPRVSIDKRYATQIRQLRQEVEEEVKRSPVRSCEKNFIELNKRVSRSPIAKRPPPVIKNLDVSFIQTRNELLNSHSIVDLLQSMDSNTARRRTVHTEPGERRSRTANLKSLSAERDRFRNFKRDLYNLSQALQRGPILLRDVNRLLQEFKANRWTLQNADDIRLKRVIMYAQEQAGKVKQPNTQRRPLSFKF